MRKHVVLGNLCIIFTRKGDFEKYYQHQQKSQHPGFDLLLPFITFFQIFSNSYYGWGGEDDDFYYRIRNFAQLRVSRPYPAYAKYTMIKHKVWLDMTKLLIILLSNFQPWQRVMNNSEYEHNLQIGKERRWAQANQEGCKFLQKSETLKNVTT